MYKFLVDINVPRELVFSSSTRKIYRARQSVRVNNKHFKQPGLMQTCRQARIEGLPVFYTRRQFRVLAPPDANIAQHAAGWLSRLSPDLTSRIKHLTLDLSWSNFKEHSFIDLLQMCNQRQATFVCSFRWVTLQGILSKWNGMTILPRMENLKVSMKWCHRYGIGQSAQLRTLGSFDWPLDQDPAKILANLKERLGGHSVTDVQTHICLFLKLGP